MLNGEEVKDKTGNNILLTNGSYKIEIVDVIGNVGTQTIIIEQIPINLTYKTIALGNKYYEATSKVNEFCNDNELYGKIDILSIFIDGKDYFIEGEPSGTNGIYVLSLKADDGDNERVMLQIETQNNTKTFLQCNCNNVGGKPE